MKKIITLFAAAALGAALIGCGSSSTEADAAKPADAATKTDTAATPPATDAK